MFYIDIDYIIRSMIDIILPISHINFSYIMMRYCLFLLFYTYIYIYFFLFFHIFYFSFFIFYFLFLIFYFLLLFIVLNYVLFSFISFIFIFIFIHFILFCFNYYFKIFSKPLLQFRSVKNSAKESFSWEENCKMRRYVLDIRY